MAEISNHGRRASGKKLCKKVARTCEKGLNDPLLESDEVWMQARGPVEKMGASEVMLDAHRPPGRCLDIRARRLAPERSFGVGPALTFTDLAQIGKGFTDLGSVHPGSTEAHVSGQMRRDYPTLSKF